MNNDYYKVLEVDRNATADDIKRSYKKLMLKYHPDRLVGKSEEEQKQAEAKCREINEAYSVLSDPQKKANYDMFGSADGMSPQAQWRSYIRKERGRDIKTNVRLTLEEIYKGATATVKLNRAESCPHCSGSGSTTNSKKQCPKCHGTGVYRTIVQTPFGTAWQTGTCPDCNGTGEVIADPCPHCNGTGLIRKDIELHIPIPAGVRDNTVLMAEGEGHLGAHQGIRGNLHLVIKEIPNDMGITRDDQNNLHYLLKCKISDLVNGAKKAVPFFTEDPLYVDIKPGTQIDEAICLEGKGCPNIIQDTVGNMVKLANGNYYVHITCSIPHKSDMQEKEKELFDQLIYYGNI